MNQRGFLTVSLLILMPLILAICAVAFAGALSIRATEKTEFICRQGALEAQNNMLESYQKLITLNPAARMLRAADKASKVSLVIPFYGALSSVSLQVARSIFHSVQLGIITAANLRLTKDLLNLKLNLAKSLGLSSYGFVQAEIVNSPRLAVEAKPPMDLTPDYFAKKDFEDLQLIQFKWTIRIDQLLPDFLIRLISTQSDSPARLEMKLKCASSVQKKQSVGDEWQATLVDKNNFESQIIKVKQALNLF
jgi:hypothetical protein